MNFTEYTSVKGKFSVKPNLCDLFKLLSIETWKRIEYAYLKPRIKVFETTVTQNLIFSINAYADQYGLDIDIFEALDESTNGNDFELIIRFPSEGVEYYAPIQAKKVYRSGVYASMDHGDQIESLINYARINNAKPLYLLYNFSSAPTYSDVALPFPMPLLGCTIVSAQHLYDNYYNQRRNRKGQLTWKIPSFDDLHPAHTFPWHELVCPSNAKELLESLRSKGLVETTNFQSIQEVAKLNTSLNQGFFPIGNFENQKNWVSTKELSVPTKDKKDTYMLINDTAYELYPTGKPENANEGNNNKKERVYPEYAPKSRIVLTK